MTLSGMEPIVQALGWTLLHSLWQISLLALIFYILITFIPQTKPDVKYIIGVVALLLTGVISAGTFFEHFTEQKEQLISEQFQQSALTVSQEIQAISVVEGQQENFFAPKAVLTQLQQWVNRHIQWLVGGWLAGVFLLSLKFAGSFYYLQRLKTRMVAETDRFWQERLSSMAKTLMISQPVRLLSSAVVQSPMLIGQLKPVILIPASMLSGLSEEQLEAIIAHELAHLYRKDYWINLMQAFLEIVFFYHPALWWMSSVIRAEREKCCDDIAVKLCGNSMVYVGALARVEELKITQSSLAMAFAGKSGGLLQRIERILLPGKEAINLKGRFVAVFLLLLSLLIILTTGESQALRYSEKKAIDAIHWVKTSYLAEKVDNSLAKEMMDSLTPVQPRQNSPMIAGTKLPMMQQDTVPTESPAPPSTRIFSFSSDSVDAPLVIDMRHIAKLTAQASAPMAFSFSTQDSLDKQIRIVLESLHDIDFDFLTEDSMIHRIRTIKAPLSPASIYFSGADTSIDLNFAVSHAISLADSAINSPMVRSSLQYLQDSTLEKRLREMEKLLREREEALATLLESREKEMEALMEMSEEEIREMEAQMEAMEKQFEEQFQQEAAMEKQLEEQLQQQETQMLKMEEEMRMKEAAMEEAVNELEKMLVSDGYIKKGTNYTFAMKADKLLINDQEVTQKVFLKYQQWLQQQQAMEYQPGNSFTIRKKAE